MKVRKLLSFILTAAVIFSSLSFSCAAAQTDEYTVNGIEILSDSFLPLKSISYPEKVGIHASITKNTYAADSAVVTLASYNPNGSLAETKLFRESGFSAGQSVGIYTMLSSVKDGYVKTFVWESLNSAKPLSDSAEKYFSNFPVGISYDDTSDRIRVRGKVSATADGKAKIELAQKYDGELCHWENASGTLYADFNGYEISDGASAELMISGYPAKNKIIAINENRGIMLMSARNQYYEINAVTLEDINGNNVKSLKKGNSVFAGAYFTRIDASTFKEPYLSLELRDGEFNLIDSAVISADEVNYNQTIHASAMFTVPENFENCIIFANIYDDLAGTNAIAVQAKRELSDFGKAEITKNTIKIKGRFAEKYDNSAVFSVNEALVPINGASRWTTNFTDYVSDVCRINLNGINIDDIIGYEALLEVEISDSGIILKNAEKVEGSDYSDIPDDSRELVLAKDGDYAKALAVLTAIGITDDTNLDKPLTRGMLAELLCKTDGRSEYANLYKNTNKFTDVEPGSDINGFCVAADKLGYLKGYASGTFKPDSVMRYSDILTAVLGVIGYKNESDPVTSAINLGLAKGISATEENSITKANALILMYNALEIPMVNAKGESIGALLLNKLNVTKFDGTIEQTPLSDDTIKNGKIQVKYERQYTAVEGSYTLQRYYMNKAQDDANPSDIYGTFMSDTRYKKATINVDERIKALAESYLDYNVEMYVKDVTDLAATLLSVYPDESKNTSISFNSRDIYNSKTNLNKNWDFVSGTVAVYSDIDAGKYDKYNIEITKVYVNGRQQAAFNIDSIRAGSSIKTTDEIYKVLQYYLDSYRYAEIKLFCNTSGDEYNIVYITDYQNLVADDVNEKTGTVVGKSYDKNSNIIGKIIFDEDEYAGRFSIIKNGAAATLADIKAGDVLTIAGYVNGLNELEYGKVIVTSEKAEGVVTTYDTDMRTIKIGDKTYYYNNYIGDKLGKEGSNGIKLGDDVSLYIDARGYAVDMDKTVNKNLKYGFATKAVKSTGVEDSWKIRILTESGTWKTYDMASKVSFEGKTAVSTTSMSNTDMQRNLDSTNVSGSKILMNKVVAYETNASNEINKIYTRATNSTDDTFNYAAIDSREYIEATSSFGGVYLNDDTVIFSYARGTDISREIDEDDIAAAKKDVFVNRNSYTATAYGLDDENCARVICGEGLAGEIALNSNFFVISNKTYAANADGDEGYNIMGICGGEEITIFADKDDTEVIDAEYNGAGKEPTFTSGYKTADVLSKGDIILYSQINGSVDKIYRLADADAFYDSTKSGGLKYTLNNNIVNLAAFEEGGDSYSFLYGFAYNRKGSRLTLANNSLAPDDLFDISGSAAICTVVNLFTDGVKVEKASLSEIESDKSGGGMGDTVFVRTFDDTTAEDIVIFKYTETPEMPPAYEPDPEPPVNPVNPQYGFATKAVKSTGIEDTWQIRILTESGKWTTYDMASKVSFDGQTSVSTTSISLSAMFEKLGGTVNGAKSILNKVIAYTTNTDGEINRIYVNANEDSVFNNAVIDERSYAEADASLGSVYLNDDTVIFSYTEGSDITKEMDEDDISAGSKAMLAGGKVYNAVAYGIDEKRYAKALCGENIFEPQDLPEIPEKYSELKYGFATKAVKSIGIEDTWQMRILTESGAWTTYDMASRVSFDGQTAVSTTSISSDRMLSQLSGTVVGAKILLNKVIAYTTNPDSGEINKIYANAVSGIDATFNYRHIDNRDYIEATASLGGVYLNDNTIIFSYAKGTDLSKEIDEDDVATAKKDSLINRNSYTAIAYGLDDENCARVISGEGLVGEIALNGNFFVISSKYNMTNADGDEGYNITGFVDGEEKTIFVDRNYTEVIDARYNGSYGEPAFDSSAKTADYLLKGDIILYSQINGNIGKIYRLIKADDLKDALQPGGLKFTLSGNIKLAAFEAGGDDYSFYLGFAYDKSGNRLTIADNKAGYNSIDLSAKSTVTGASVDLFASKIKVSPATSGDINADKTGEGKGDVVFVRTLNDTIVENFVVFKSNY